MVSARKDDYSWLLLISVGVFIIAAVSLIYWRAEEIERIKKLFRKVKYLKDKYNTMKPSTESVEF